MSLISKNVQLGPRLKLSSWRKVAIGTWKTVGDPSVYGFIDIDFTPSLRYLDLLRQQTTSRITITHLVGKAMAETLRRNPGINCILRFGCLYPRKNIDIFFQVASDTS
jgi:pyruvate/2-oxoglutarate dehydrogenase complex dihydrolipoamide acyltransferase (E2) component